MLIWWKTSVFFILSFPLNIFRGLDCNAQKIHFNTGTNPWFQTPASTRVRTSALCHSCSEGRAVQVPWLMYTKQMNVGLIFRWDLDKLPCSHVLYSSLGKEIMLHEANFAIQEHQQGSWQQDNVSWEVGWDLAEFCGGYGGTQRPGASDAEGSCPANQCRNCGGGGGWATQNDAQRETEKAPVYQGSERQPEGTHGRESLLFPDKEPEILG